MSQESLLLAVRDRIRQLCGYSPEECDIQPDEYAPQTVGECYVAVIEGEASPGPRHDSSGGVVDEIHSVQVVVIQRAASIPADRLSNLLATNLGNINARCDAIQAVIDFSYDTTNLANTYIANAAKVYNHPLVWRGTGKMGFADAEMFKGAKYNNSTRQEGGVKKVISFGGARLTSVRP